LALTEEQIIKVAEVMLEVLKWWKKS
jgi:hypothetical protein